MGPFGGNMPCPRGNGGRQNRFLTEYSYNSYISYDHTNSIRIIRMYTNCTNFRMTECSVIYTKFRSYTNIRMCGLFAQVWLFLAVFRLCGWLHAPLPVPFATQLVRVGVCVCGLASLCNTHCSGALGPRLGSMPVEWCGCVHLFRCPLQHKPF